MKTPLSLLASALVFAVLLAGGVQPARAQVARPADVPLPGNAAVSTVSIPATFTLAVVRPKMDKARSQALAVGQRGPDFQLKTPDGRVVKLSDYKGKVVVLNFWAMWCGHCVAELPDFVELQRNYADRGLVVLGITADDYDRLYQGSLPPEPALQAKLRSFAATRQMTYPILMDTAAVKESYPHSALPATYVLDRAGVLRATSSGEWHLAEAEEAVLPLLAK